MPDPTPETPPPSPTILEEWWIEHMTMMCKLADHSGAKSFSAQKKDGKWHFEVIPED
jgi:hypothetical protein